MKHLLFTASLLLATPALAGNPAYLIDFGERDHSNRMVLVHSQGWGWDSEGSCAEQAPSYCLYIDFCGNYRVWVPRANAERITDFLTASRANAIALRSVDGRQKLCTMWR
ncbi:hypothetical protein [Aliiroseovarius sp.]|uniref:hypothetical protein n=1 Tax=Aliiroseovarius sp. TaxID=1872442 RepID=UPI003BAD66B6